MTRRSNAGFFERLRGPRSTSYRGELQRRRHEAKLEAARRREAEREEIRRERQKVRDANKLKRQLLAEERREEQKRRKEEEREAPHKAMPSASAIERAYQRGAKTLSEAMEMARGNPGKPKYYVLVDSDGGMIGRPFTTRAAAERQAKKLKANGYHDVRVSPWFSNPPGTKGRFERCVKAVSERGGAYDPRAVCGAQEKKYQKNPRGMWPQPYEIDTAVNKRAQAMARSRKQYTRAESDRAARALISKLYGRNAMVEDSQVSHIENLLWNDYNSYDPGYKGFHRTAVAKRGRRKLKSMGFFNPGKRNPADAAIAVSEEFHGRKVKAMIPVQEKRHYHKYLAELGELRKLVVLCRDGKHRVTLSKFDGAILAANEDKNQLFIVGGDQSVNLNDFGIKNPHETETLGEVITIDYFTDKEHLGDEGGVAVYTHKFRSTNDNGKHKTVRMAEYPNLIYHLRDEHLEFSGGSYEIRAEGIDL